MGQLKNFFASRWGIIGVGAFIGVLAPLLQKWGNPGNMKLTIDKDTLTVVNISGGGCPDVPYLAQEMVGKTLADAPQPKEIGHTLCGYALQLAYEEMRRQCQL